MHLNTTPFLVLIWAPSLSIWDFNGILSLSHWDKLSASQQQNQLSVLAPVHHSCSQKPHPFGCAALGSGELPKRFTLRLIPALLLDWEHTQTISSCTHRADKNCVPTMGFWTVLKKEIKKINCLYLLNTYHKWFLLEIVLSPNFDITNSEAWNVFNIPSRHLQQ